MLRAEYEEHRAGRCTMRRPRSALALASSHGDAVAGGIHLPSGARAPSAPVHPFRDRVYADDLVGGEGSDRPFLCPGRPGRVGRRRAGRFNATTTESKSYTWPNRLSATSVFDRLLKDRIIWLGSEVRDDNSNEIAAKLLLLAAEDPKKDIYLYVNSPGGSITAGMAIYDTMQFVPNDIVTVGIGMAASMGQLLLTSGTKGKRPIRLDAPLAAAPAARRLRRHRQRHPDAGAAHPRHEEASRRDHLRRADRQDTSSRSTRTATATAGSAAQEALEYGFVDHIRAHLSDVIGGGGTAS